MRVIAALFSLTVTWGGFEFYHLMREADFLSLSAIGCAIASVGCIWLGGYVARTAVQ